MNRSKAHDLGWDGAKARKWDLFLCQTLSRCLFSELCWLAMSLVSCSLYFSEFVSEKSAVCERPVWTKEQRVARFPSTHSFPSTSASWTLHQQKSGLLGSENNSRETSIVPRHLLFMLQALSRFMILDICVNWWTGRKLNWEWRIKDYCHFSYFLMKTRCLDQKNLECKFQFCLVCLWGHFTGGSWSVSVKLNFLLCQSCVMSAPSVKSNIIPLFMRM